MSDFAAQIDGAIATQKQNSGMTAEDFEKSLKAQNISAETLREEARKDLAISALQDKYSGKINISDREVEEYYTNNRQQFVKARGVALADVPRLLRSSTRPYPHDEEPIDGLVREDIDGDGRVLTMRVPDSNGPWKVSARDPRLMVRRDPTETGGRYYRLLPEGRIEHLLLKRDPSLLVGILKELQSKG